MGDKKKRCPRCNAKGTGPYARWVLNSRKRRYESYVYFAHKARGKIKWCYLGRPSGKQLSNMGPSPGKALSNREGNGCRRCRYLTALDAQPFCTWHHSILMPETLNQPCVGFEEKTPGMRG